MEALRIKNAANKALIVADAQYHSWSAQRQERCRASMNEEAESRVEAALLKEMLDIRCTAESAGEIF